MEDKMGDVQKAFENVTRYYLPPKSYYVLRIDGKSFHNLCRNMDKPFDMKFIDAMDAVLLAMCHHIQGSILGYVESDEASIIFTDKSSANSQMWFGGNIQKIASVTASIATAAFNKARYMSADVNGMGDLKDFPVGHFDSRVYSLSNLEDVISYLEWRNLDCTRNAVSMAAHSMFSTKTLHKKSSKEMQEMMFTEKGVNFNNYPAEFKSGRVCVKEYKVSPVTYTHKKTKETKTVEVERGEWVIQPSPVFTRTEGKEWLNNQLKGEKYESV